LNNENSRVPTNENEGTMILGRIPVGTTGLDLGDHSGENAPGFDGNDEYGCDEDDCSTLHNTSRKLNCGVCWTDSEQKR